MLSPDEMREIEHELVHVPQKRGACIDALRILQRHRGWISDDAINDLAPFLDMSPAELDSVATFYNLIFRQPVGRHVILLCDSVSCWVMGSDALRESASAELGIRFGETTADGRFTMLPIQCLGICDRAPALMVNEDTYQDFTRDNMHARLRDAFARYL